MSSKFIWEPGDIVVAQCNFCKHRGLRGECTAFPDGIPGEILGNQHDHREPYSGDGGIRFEPVNAEAADAVAQMFRNGPRREKVVRARREPGGTDV